MTITRYEITKRITTGSLAGMVLTEEMRSDAALGAPFTAGDEIPAGATGPGYTVIRVEVAPGLNVAIERAQRVYDMAVSVWRYAQAAEARLAGLPYADGECPCGCERQAATMAAERADALCAEAAEQVRALRALRDAGAGA